jgi:hypothetical protein
LKQKAPAFIGRDFLMFVFLFIILVFLPHGEFAASGESGLDSHKRQNPTIEDIPRGKDGQKNE